MHELSLLETVMEVVLEQAARHSAARVHRVALRVGHLSGIVPEALAFAFEVATRGTIAEGAALDVENVAVVCDCPECGTEFVPVDVVYQCPRCGRLSTDVRRGRELELTSLEVS